MKTFLRVLFEDFKLSQIRIVVALLTLCTHKQRSIEAEDNFVLFLRFDRSIQVVAFHAKPKNNFSSIRRCRNRSGIFPRLELSRMSDKKTLKNAVHVLIDKITMLTPTSFLADLSLEHKSLVSHSTV